MELRKNNIMRRLNNKEDYNEETKDDRGII